MTRHAFDFLELRPWPSKPRTSGLFIGSDRGMPLGVQRDLLESHSDIIDYAKFSDHAGLASRYSEAWWKKKMELYRRYDIHTTMGGVSFELAVLQNKVDAYFQKVKDVGFTSVEVSEDVIPQMSSSQRKGTISKARALGLEVVTEVGRKYPDKPLEAREAMDSIGEDLANGARMVTIEAAETAVLKDSNPRFVVDVVEAIGLDKICFECSPPYPWTDVAVWLIKTLGPGVNLLAIDMAECNAVYSMRQGMHRMVGHSFLTRDGGRK